MLLQLSAMQDSLVQTLITFVLIIHPILCDNVLQTFDGAVDGGNYTYYNLIMEGQISILLNIIQGDADVYISSEIAKPTYDQYDLHSASCGHERIDIPEKFRRPIGIGVYGYPRFDKSKYEISVVQRTYVEDEYVPYSYDNEEAQLKMPGGTTRAKPSVPHDEEESLAWTILVTVLKIIFDILT